ncbi:hypothetical protein ABE527_14160 [Brucella sp. TWI432]
MRSNSLSAIENKARHFQRYAAQNAISARDATSADVKRYYQEGACLYAKDARRHLFMLIDESN